MFIPKYGAFSLGPLARVPEPVGLCHSQGDTCHSRGPASQPGDVGWAGCCTPCLDVRLRPAGMGAWSPPHPPCEVPTNGHTVCVRAPRRPRRCGGREDTAVAPRVLPVGREAGQEVALATVRGSGRRGAGRPGRGFTSGHTGDRAGPRRLLQKTARVTKSTRRGRAGATSSGNGPNVRAVTCAGASLTRRKAHRSPRGERASAGRRPCSWELCGRAADTALRGLEGSGGPVLLTPPPPPAPLHVRPRVPAGDP